MLAEPSQGIVIRNAKGEEVARGKMPFGGGGTCGYSWRVPRDLEPAGAEETFWATVTYDTLDLYGKVEIAYPIVVKAN